MRNIKSVLLLCLAGVVLAVDNKIDVQSAHNEYCELCEDHTFCQYKGIGAACGETSEGGVSAEEKKIILEIHNGYRRHVAKGFESRGLKGAQPPAANMLQMQWDDELAKLAQHWTDQCLFQHDQCRRVERFKVGQNMYWQWRFPIINTVNWTAAIASWYDEVLKFDHEAVNSYQFSNETGHYTQLVWHDSHLIGCGRRSYGPNKIYGCNYGPTGNWLNEPLYSVGEPCSSCPSGTHCRDALCAMDLVVDPAYTAVAAGNSEDDLAILNPPSIDAVSVYNDTEKEGDANEKPTQDPITTLTDLPPPSNLFDYANSLDYEELSKDINEVKMLLDKVMRKFERIEKYKKNVLPK